MNLRIAPSEATHVAVVVTAFNHARFLDAALDSVCAQTHPLWSCVVVDDESTDDTLAIAKRASERDPRIVVHSQANLGEGGARNTGFRLTDPGADFVLFLDADDVLMPSALEVLLSAAQSRDGVIGAHGLADRIDDVGGAFDPGRFVAHGRRRLVATRVGYRRLRSDERTTFSTALVHHTLFPPAVLMVASDTLRIAGDWTSLPFCADWEMNLRLLGHGPMAYVDEVVAGYRTHSSSATSRAMEERSDVDHARLAHCVKLDALVRPRPTGPSLEEAKRAWRACQVLATASLLHEARTAIADRSYRTVPRSLARIVVAAVRFIRGTPSRRQAGVARRTIQAYRQSPAGTSDG